jgi:hypothetical protein
LGKSPVLGAAFGIFAVWWLISFVAYLVTGKVWTGGMWIESTVRAWGGLLSGALVGTAITVILVMVARQWKLASMAGDDVRGVRCSIGQLPMHVVLPPMAERFPDKNLLVFPPKEHDRQSKLNIDWMDEWFKKYERDFPDHAKLMRAVARMLNHNPMLPAAAKKNYRGDPRSSYGDDRHDHGKLTLLAHSWLGGSVGVWKSVNGFSYKGLQNALEENQNIKLNDPDYKFDPFDPLIGLICFIHDIGKIATFKVQKDGSVVQTRSRSDTVGAALIAKMEEFWALPYEDRMIITLTVGNYRKPSNMPLRRDINNPNQAIALSDRTMAMLKLITEVDDEVGAIEKNTEVEAPSLDSRQQAQATYDEDMWDCFKALLNESFRIHHENHKFRVGQKNTLPSGTIVTLKEDVLRAELSQKLGIRRRHYEADPKLEGAGFTQRLLAILATKACLVTEVAGIKLDPINAIWKVEFHGKDKAKSGEAISTWPYAIMINPETYFPRLSNDPDASSTPNVVGPSNVARMTEARVPRPAGPVDALVQGALEDEDGIPMLGEGTKGAKRGGKGQGRPAAPTAVSPDHVAPPLPAAGAKVAVIVSRTPSTPEPAIPAARPPQPGDLPPMPTRPAAKKVPAGGTATADDNRGEVPAPSNVVPMKRKVGTGRPQSEHVEQVTPVATPSVAAPSPSSSSFLDEVDPQDEQPSPEGQAGSMRAAASDDDQSDGTAIEGVAAAVAGEKTVEVQVSAVTQAPTPQAAPAAAKANLLDGLRDKLWRDAHAAPTQSRSDAPGAAARASEAAAASDRTSPSPATQALPSEVVEVTRILAKRLEWLEYLRRQKKIAADRTEDGRFAYSFEAIKAHDQKMEWLSEDVLRLLAIAKRTGASAPVCFMRTPEGVSLIVVNPAMVSEING